VKGYLVPAILSIIITIVLYGADDFFHDAGMILLIVIGLFMVVIFRFLGNLFTAPSKVFHEQQAIIDKYRRQIVISERTRLLILSTSHSHHMAPGEVVQYIALNSENPYVTKATIEDGLAVKAFRGEIEVSAIPRASLERHQVPSEVFNTHSIRIMPWKNRFKRVWPYDSEVDRVGGQIYRKDDPTDIAYEGLLFVRSQIEHVYPALGMAGRKKRREMLTTCPACITQKDAEKHVAKYEIDVKFANMPRYCLFQAVLEGKISTWEKEAGSGLAIEISEDRIKEVISPLFTFGTTRDKPNLRFCLKQLQDVWYD